VTPSIPRKTFQLFLSLFLLAPSLLFAQSSPATVAAVPSDSTQLAPDPQPPDAPAPWKQLVGIYRYSSNGSPNQSLVILERGQRLFLQPMDSAKPPEEIRESGNLVSINDGSGRWFGYTEHRDATGTVSSLTYLQESFIRTDAGSDPSRFFRITPRKPLADLRALALASHPPHESQSFRRPDLVELTTLDASIRLDIRYAQSNNFLSTPVYTQARAFMQRPAAEALARVSRKLQPLGFGLLIHDAYRPWYVTKIFWDATPPEDHQFVANPNEGSKHNRGCAVDLTLYGLATANPAEMPGLYDEMSPRSFPTFLGGTSLQRWRRDLLRRAMESEGFSVNESEWWHFDYKDWKHYPLINVPFEDLGNLLSNATPAT